MTDTDKTVKQRALAHFKNKLAGNLFSVEIPEWESTIYYRATASMAVEARIMGLTAQGKTADALVESIVLKSLDQDGNRLFKDTDRIELMNEADPNVIIKLATALNNANADTIGDIEKN